MEIIKVEKNLQKNINNLLLYFIFYILILMDYIFRDYLKDLIAIKSFKNVRNKHKNVISTCIFMPESPSVNYKTPVYITGLIKNIETFSKIMGDEWILRVYFDKMYFTGVKEKVIYEEDEETGEKFSIKGIDKILEAVARHDSESSGVQNNTNTLTDNSDYEYTFNKTTKPSRHNSKYTTGAKIDIINNKERLKKLIKIIHLYFKKIITNKDKKYKNIELYSFSCPKASRNNPELLGHSKTFGSIMRFLPIYDSDVDIVFCINSRYSISPIFKKLIDNWSKNKTKKMFTFSYKNDFIDKSVLSNISDEIKTIMINPSKKVNNLFIEFVDQMTEIKHSMFNDSEPSTFKDILKLYKSGINTGSLDGLINSGCDEEDSYEENRTSIAAGIFGIKRDCPLIIERITMFSKLLRYYILTNNDFEYGIDEVLLKLVIAFESGTLDIYNDKTVDYKNLGESMLVKMSLEKLKRFGKKNKLNLEEMGVTKGKDLLDTKFEKALADKFKRNPDILESIEDQIFTMQRVNVDYISHFVSITDDCSTISNILDFDNTFLTDSNGVRIKIINNISKYNNQLPNLYFTNKYLNDIMMYDAKSILIKENGARVKKNEDIVFNFCNDNDDNLEFNIMTLFTYFDEHTPLFVYDSSLDTIINRFLNFNHSYIDFNNEWDLKDIEEPSIDYFYTLYDLNEYTTKNIETLLNKIVTYYNKAGTIKPYKIKNIKSVDDLKIKDHVKKAFGKILTSKKNGAKKNGAKKNGSVKNTK